MSEDIMRCSKCGATLTGENCTSCGAENQSRKCEHCEALSPRESQWCSGCGRRLSRMDTEGVPGEDTVPGGGGVWRFVCLLALIAIACALIWKLSPQPEIAAIAIAPWIILFLAAPGRLSRRVSRILPLLGGAILSAGIVCTFHPHGAVVRRPHTLNATPRIDVSPSPVHEAYAAGVVLARFDDGQLDGERVRADLTRAHLGFGPADGYAPPALNFGETIEPETRDVKIVFGPTIPTLRAVAALRADPEVAFAEPDFIYQASHIPDDPYYDEKYDSRDGLLDQWYLPRIGAPAAWDHLRSVHSDIRVAIIDTGVDYKHPDLKDVVARDSKGAIVGRSFVSGIKATLDDNGHGTHCAGIAAAATDNGIGVAGVGFNSFRIVPAKVLTRGGYGQVDWISKAIIWCADNGCRVESMSLGGSQYSQALQDAINYAWKKGTIVVAAAGNSATSIPGYPAGNNHVVAVSATDPHDRLTYFSNYGTPIAVGAPGLKILATLPSYPCELTKRFGFKQNYDSLSGTSMACPIVAGTLGALIACQKSLTPTEAIQRLERTAENVAGTPGGGWEEELGHGRLSLRGAILDEVRPSSVGSLYGQIISEKDIPLAGAQICCEGRSVTTRPDGMFRLANMKPGQAELTVTADGRPSIKKKVDVIAGVDNCLTAAMPAK